MIMMGKSIRQIWVKRIVVADFKMNRDMRKPDFCISENKDADQLCSNCTADQQICFRYTDGIRSLIFLYPKFQASSLFLRLYSTNRPVCVGPSRKPRRQVFSRRGPNSATKLREDTVHNFVANFYFHINLHFKHLSILNLLL